MWKVQKFTCALTISLDYQYLYSFMLGINETYDANRFQVNTFKCDKCIELTIFIPVTISFSSFSLIFGTFIYWNPTEISRCGF